MLRRAIVFGLGLALAVPAVSLHAQTLRVLVTNDDGIAAAGIDALVTALSANPNLQITVIAPATNQSGSGDMVTTTPISTMPASTAGAFLGTAVNGRPADTVMFGVRQQLAGNPPQLVVSGINDGQNLSAGIIPISGTVGAAFWAGRLDIPAIAVSAGNAPSPNFAQAATYTAALVERFRVNKGFQKKMHERDGVPRALVLNVNFPTCTSGSVRGVRLVTTSRASIITSYTLLSTMGTTQNWQPNLTSINFGASNCNSTSGDPANDVEAFINGYASVTPLDSERSVSGRRMKDFRFVEKLFP